MPMGEEVPAAEEPPVIDLSDITKPERRREIVRSISEACETWGFFQITNHGLDEALMKRTIEVFTEFFQLPDEEKLSIEAPQVPGGHSQGYFRPRKDGQNATEFLYNLYGPEEDIDGRPSQPPSFQSTVEAYVEAMDGLSREILGLLSEGLGLPRTTLQLYMGSTHGVRTNYYQPTQNLLENAFTVSPHSDPGALTLLLTNDVSGTQVKKDDRWVQISPVPCSFLVNVGDQIEILSNGRYMSVLHQGVPDEVQHRLTIATFTHPLPSTVVGPVPLLLDKSHPPLYKTQTYSSYFGTFLTKGLVGRSLIEEAKI
ncbi:hypothetical protein R1sor_006747 [Riccia sorocarpa]|uniref:Fe2OG dioxygenase domain-containing protein n=1 Tax=Riccia sorocarpa TaxID=122646 RepID=A0ABD3HQK9_9MARC